MLWYTYLFSTNKMKSVAKESRNEISLMQHFVVVLNVILCQTILCMEL